MTLAGTWISVAACANQEAKGCAVEELAQGWRDDPETLAFIKSLALSDKKP